MKCTGEANHQLIVAAFLQSRVFSHTSRASAISTPSKPGWVYVCDWLREEMKESYAKWKDAECTCSERSVVVSSDIDGFSDLYEYESEFET